VPGRLGEGPLPRQTRLDGTRLRPPEIAAPPDPAPVCCTQSTITVPSEVNAKTAQKHDDPSRAHRHSLRRRTAVERSYATMEDPASTDTTRGFCRVMGLYAVTLLVACGVVVRNIRVADAFEERQRDNAPASCGRVAHDDEETPTTDLGRTRPGT
jgi:hypothetical protein